MALCAEIAPHSQPGGPIAWSSLSLSGIVAVVLARGASNAEIAAALIISTHTAKHHVSRVLAKLGVTGRAAAAGAARDLGLA